MNYSRGFLTTFEVIDYCENLIKVMDSFFQKNTDTLSPRISRDPYGSRTLWAQDSDSEKRQRN